MAHCLLISVSESEITFVVWACVEGEPDARIPAGLEISPMGLQDYFISLMNQEDVK